MKSDENASRAVRISGDGMANAKKRCIDDQSPSNVIILGFAREWVSKLMAEALRVEARPVHGQAGNPLSWQSDGGALWLNRRASTR
jgi:hypothetical protein